MIVALYQDYRTFDWSTRFVLDKTINATMNLETKLVLRNRKMLRNQRMLRNQTYVIHVIEQRCFIFWPVFWQIFISGEFITS